MQTNLAIPDKKKNLILVMQDIFRIYYWSLDSHHTPTTKKTLNKFTDLWCVELHIDRHRRNFLKTPITLYGNALFFIFHIEM